MNNPLFAGNPQLQEQFRSQLPVFLQQVPHTFQSSNSFLDVVDLKFLLKWLKDSPGNIRKDGSERLKGGKEVYCVLA